MKMSYKHSGFQQGFTLVELMIAIALGIFITGGMIALFINTNQSYRVQENQSRLQENGQFAINFLSQDLRMTDYWGCLSSSAGIVNNLNLGSGFDDFSDAITATNNTGLNNSDTITIKRVIPSEIYINNIPATTSSDIQTTSGSGLSTNDVVLISDCSVGDIFQITGIDTSDASFDSLAHTTTAPLPTTNPGYPGNTDNVFEKKYATDAQVYRMIYSTYSIATGSNNQPALYKSINGAAPEELIEGIENMQIQYGVDTDADNTPNFYVDSAGLTAAQMNQVVSVRISLVALSIEDNLSTKAMPYTVFGTTSTPADRRIRRVFNTTIAVRNRLP